MTKPKNICCNEATEFHVIGDALQGENSCQSEVTKQQGGGKQRCFEDLESLAPSGPLQSAQSFDLQSLVRALQCGPRDL